MHFILVLRSEARAFFARSQHIRRSAIKSELSLLLTERQAVKRASLVSDIHADEYRSEENSKFHTTLTRDEDT